MTAAIDFGSSEFRSLRYQGNHLVARRIPAAYCVLEETPTHRRLLERIGAPHSACQGSLIVVGDAARQVAEALRQPEVPLFPKGELPSDDPVGRQVCASLIDSLIPDGHQGNPLCTLTAPRQPAAFLAHLLHLRGYRTQVLHPATAVVLAELESAEFTGLAMTFGAETSTFSLCHLGQPLLELAAAHGSRSVEEGFARRRHRYLWDAQGNKYLDLPAMRRWLQGGTISLHESRDGDEQWLADAYWSQLSEFCPLIKRELAQHVRQLPRTPFPLVVSGGPVHLDGFPELLREAIQLSKWPLKISDIRVATFDPYSVARGSLVHSLLEDGHSASHAA